MRRAANQSGGVIPPLAIRPTMVSEDEERDERAQEQETSYRAVSNGGAAGVVSSPRNKEPEKEIEKEKPEVRMEAAPKLPESFDDMPKAAAALQAPQSPIQQLQIVRLLTDLGDRLRQSEKEREILWKEVDNCRKQISEMEGRGDKTEKAYITLENQLQQREEFIESLKANQAKLEGQIQEQVKLLETSKNEQHKLQEKLSSIETATGSAIVRVEDAIAESSKLSKRVEMLGQDKARLLHKLETMEETLTQTQDSLKAKALVLLTDQALAARTNLPQTPAWTGNDTLKVARAAAENVAAANNPAADLTASLNKKPGGLSTNTLVLIGLVCLGIVGGVIAFKQINSAKAPEAAVTVEEKPAAAVEDNSSTETSASEKTQEQLMADIATMANNIEPSSLKEEDTQAVNSAETAVKSDAEAAFEAAQDAEDKAVADFKADGWSGTAKDHITPDKSLPKSAKDVEHRAFAGDAEAQHDMAVIYTSGQGGVKINYNRAIKWFDEAAHNGVANAQYNLAVLYHQGLGVNKDLTKAIQLYRVAAAAGHPEAQYNMAIAYIEGVGSESNPQIADMYFQRAAEGGVTEAAYNLGLLHENGLLGESQPDEAIFWYTLAADKGNPEAKNSLAQLKTQLSMNDDDMKRIVERVAKQKPAFLNDKGQPEMPPAKNMRPVPQSNEAASATPPDAAELSEPTSLLEPKAIAVDHTQNAMLSQIEEQLIRLNLYDGLPDGKMSAKVSEAIKSYQKSNGMTVDGKPTEDLLVHMLAAQAQN